MRPAPATIKPKQGGKNRQKAEDIILVGDLINNATRNSVSNVFEETMRPREQKKMMTQMLIQDCGGISPSLQARMGTGGNQIPLTFSMQSFGDYKENEISSSCKQRDSKDATDLVVGIDDEKNAYIDQFGTLKAHASGGTQQYVMERMVVRRLTPLECTRLQGFPDGWVGIGDWTDEKGRIRKEADAPKYKALGNSIALPFWRWMFGRMAAYLPEGATLGSLFDGIGAFPLCWESIHGKGTAVWASEIEPFPIAVTKKHFGDEENNVEGDLWNILEK